MEFVLFLCVSAFCIDGICREKSEKDREFRMLENETVRYTYVLLVDVIHVEIGCRCHAHGRKNEMEKSWLKIKIAISVSSFLRKK